MKGKLSNRDKPKTVDTGFITVMIVDGRGRKYFIKERKK